MASHADKYEPTTDIHNVFIYVLVPVVIYMTLSTSLYKKVMGFTGPLIRSTILFFLPPIIYVYYTDIPKVFGKTRFIMILVSPLIFILCTPLVALCTLVKDVPFLRKFVLDRYSLIIPYCTADLIVNLYFFSYFCKTTFKTYDYLYIVIPISCLYLSLLLRTIIDIFKKKEHGLVNYLTLVVFIFKSFVVTAILSPSTIVTNSLLALFAIPALLDTYYSGEYLKSKRKRKLEKLVKELNTYDQNGNAENTDTSTSEFDLLFQNISENKKTQKGIRHYYSFGKAFVDRFDHYKQLGNKERTAQALVNEEVRDQLLRVNKKVRCQLLKFKDIDIYIDVLLERAQKIYDFFNEIGEDKMQRVKSFSAIEISELSSKEIDYILVEPTKSSAIPTVNPSDLESGS